MATHNNDDTARLMAHAQATADIIAEYWNGTATNDDGEKASLCDWVADQLDISVIADLDGDYKACEIDVTIGGPYVYVDTREGAVIATASGAGRACVGLPRDVVDNLDEIVSEIWASN